VFFDREVKIYVNRSDYGILKFENNLLIPDRKEMLKYAIDQKYIYQSVIMYKKAEGVYFPYYIRTRKYASNTNPLINSSLQYSDIEFLTTRFIYKDYERIKVKYVIKKDQDINNIETDYNESFWKSYNTVVLNPVSSKAKRDLEKKQSLESQYKQNKN
jgi:hypothetical protein